MPQVDAEYSAVQRAALAQLADDAHGRAPLAGQQEAGEYHQQILAQELMMFRQPQVFAVLVDDPQVRIGAAAYANASAEAVEAFIDIDDRVVAAAPM